MSDRTAYMCNLMGWGIGVDATKTAERCRCCGPFRYDYGAVVNICRGKSYVAKVEVDGEVFEGDFSIIMVRPIVYDRLLDAYEFYHFFL
jgi:hypothetical protein